MHMPVFGYTCKLYKTGFDEGMLFNAYTPVTPPGRLLTTPAILDDFRQDQTRSIGNGM